MAEGPKEDKRVLSLVRGTSLADHLSKDDSSTIGAIVLPWKYTIQEGSELMDGVVVGKFLGAGMQARVYQLQTQDGRPLGKVLKVNRGDIGSQMLNNNQVWVGMDKEWKIGTQLRTMLQQPDGSLPGFMTVNDVVLRKSESGVDPRKGRMRFAGMVLGELRGWEIYKRLDMPEFHNVHYVKEMLFQVFSALDRAQRKLGFNHADLGMRNVMEHYPRTWEQIPGGAAAAEHVPHIPGYTCNANGSRLPLGPEVEFKIIDFGISKMSAKLAEAAGGREAQENVARVQQMFAHGRRIVFEGKSKRSALEMETSDFEHERFGWFKRVVLRRSSDQQFRLNRTTPRPGSPELSSAASEAASTDDDASSEPQLFAMQAPEEVVLSESEVQQACKWAHVKKTKSPIEKLYRSFWHRKGDVFHLLLGMALALDNRVWPEEDADDVTSLLSLVYHVTGLRLKASFAEAGQGQERSLFGKLACVGRPQVVGFKAHTMPFNSGLLAGEALVHPLFRSYRSCQPPHAETPVPLAKLFPEMGL
ncbi:hypothetical protein COHA_007250 [Chlorella ohadii]|uniref:Protein kinase domain-containing protein n=1 Tax=Chlorella ohadii TaxID=2649997 RepID=A0AAD5DMR8_9CHLO|nr:hypothetical protein COHA_007250 [Chlorella ohadii]